MYMWLPVSNAESEWFFFLSSICGLLNKKLFFFVASVLVNSIARVNNLELEHII